MFGRPIEKDTYLDGRIDRVMPKDLNVGGSYLLRLLCPPGGPEFAEELLAFVEEKEEDTENDRCRFVCNVISEIAIRSYDLSVTTNCDGYLVFDNNLQDPEQPDLERGYFIHHDGQYKMVFRLRSSDPAAAGLEPILQPA